MKKFTKCHLKQINSVINILYCFELIFLIKQFNENYYLFFFINLYANYYSFDLLYDQMCRWLLVRRPVTWRPPWRRRRNRRRRRCRSRSRVRSCSEGDGSTASSSPCRASPSRSTIPGGSRRRPNTPGNCRPSKKVTKSFNN